jgi:hypothetical protein
VALILTLIVGLGSLVLANVPTPFVIGLFVVGAALIVGDINAIYNRSGKDEADKVLVHRRLDVLDRIADATKDDLVKQLCKAYEEIDALSKRPAYAEAAYPLLHDGPDVRTDYGKGLDRVVLDVAALGDFRDKYDIELPHLLKSLYKNGIVPDDALNAQLASVTSIDDLKSVAAGLLRIINQPGIV